MRLESQKLQSGRADQSRTRMLEIGHNHQLRYSCEFRLIPAFGRLE